MAGNRENRERDQGLREGKGVGIGQQGGQHAPSRNPQGDRSAGSRQVDQKQIDYTKRGSLGGQQGGVKRGNGGSYKEGGWHEQKTQR
jgi:hypothetical protein